MGLNQWADDRADDERSGGERPAPRHGRAALLRLASWFEAAEPERADALAAAAYTLYPSRHLKGRVDESVAATTGWWQAEPDRSTVTERPGTRPPEPVRDHRAQQARLRDAAESSAHWRRTGAAQVRALLARPTGPRAHLDLSGAGMEVLMELLTAALGSGDAGCRPTSAGDLEFALRLHVVSAPGSEVVVQGEGGELTLEGLRLCVTPYEQHEIPPELLEPPADDAPTPPGGLPLPTPPDDAPTPPNGIPTVPPSSTTQATPTPDAPAASGAGAPTATGGQAAYPGYSNTSAAPGPSAAAPAATGGQAAHSGHSNASAAPGAPAASSASSAAPAPNTSATAVPGAPAASSASGTAPAPGISPGSSALGAPGAETAATATGGQAAYPGYSSASAVPAAPKAAAAPVATGGQAAYPGYSNTSAAPGVSPVPGGPSAAGATGGQAAYPGYSAATNAAAATGGQAGYRGAGEGRTATPAEGMAVEPPTAAIPVVKDDDDRDTGPIDLGRERPWTRTWG